MCLYVCGRLNSGPVCLHVYSYVHKSEMHFSPLVEFENTLQSEPVLYIYISTWQPAINALYTVVDICYFNIPTTIVFLKPVCFLLSTKEL